MKIEIKLDAAVLDIHNISIKDFNKETQDMKEVFSKTELDFSSINKLKGNKELLHKAFLNEMVESLNL
jgi:hypothetical protein